mmetsp:Transcript_14566/g.35674  ORF Transcript_14566/g.35674 Transcript_14566/m.35674 type:complete len:174 (-) Transcript_14566:761-1282(-)
MSSSIANSVAFTTSFISTLRSEDIHILKLWTMGATDPGPALGTNERLSALLKLPVLLEDLKRVLLGDLVRFFFEPDVGMGRTRGGDALCFGGVGFMERAFRLASGEPFFSTGASMSTFRTTLKGARDASLLEGGGFALECVMPSASGLCAFSRACTARFVVISVREPAFECDE